MDKYNYCFKGFIFIVFGILVSCSNEKENELSRSETVNARYIELKVKVDNPPLTTLDKRSRFTQTLPQSGNGKLTYAFNTGDKLDIWVRDWLNTPMIIMGRWSLSCSKVDTATGEATFSGLVGPELRPDYFDNMDSLYIVTGGLANAYDNPYHTALIRLTDKNQTYYAGTQFKPYNKADIVTTCLYGTNRGLISYDNPSRHWNVDLNMVRSYVTIKVEKNVLSLPCHTIDFNLDCDNRENSGLFPQDTRTTTKNDTIYPVHLNLTTGEVSGFTVNKIHENHNSYSITKEDLADIINNYDGLLSFPIYPGEFKNFRITIATEAVGKIYQWKSNSVNFTIVIGKPSKVDDISNNIYSANRNFFFGKVTELKTP